jgi:hypothetical protein
VLHTQLDLFCPILPAVTKHEIIYFVTSRGSSMALDGRRFHLKKHIICNILDIYILNCINRVLDQNTRRTHICFSILITLYSNTDLSVRIFRGIHTIDISMDCCSTIPPIFITQYHLISELFCYPI